MLSQEYSCIIWTGLHDWLGWKGQAEDYTALVCCGSQNHMCPCTAGLWVSPLVGRVFLWLWHWASSCPGVITLTAAPQQRCSPPSAGCPFASLGWYRPRAKAWGAKRVIQREGKEHSPLPSLCCRHCCRGKLPRPRAPSLANTSHGSVQEMHFCSCRSGLPPGGGSHTRLSDRRWVQVGGEKWVSWAEIRLGETPANQKCSFSESWAPEIAPFLRAGRDSSRCLERRCFGVHLFIIVYWTCEILLKRRPENRSSTKPDLEQPHWKGVGICSGCCPLLWCQTTLLLFSCHWYSQKVQLEPFLKPKQRVRAWDVLPCMLLMMSVQDVSFAHPSNPLPSQFSHDPFQLSFSERLRSPWAVVLGGAEWGKSECLGTGEYLCYSPRCQHFLELCSQVCFCKSLEN